MTSRRLFVWMLFATALSTVGKAAGQTSFTVGTATRGAGPDRHRRNRSAAGSDAALSIPVAVVHGAKPGPVLALARRRARHRVRVDHRARAADRRDRRDDGLPAR